MTLSRIPILLFLMILTLALAGEQSSVVAQNAPAAQKTPGDQSRETPSAESDAAAILMTEAEEAAALGFAQAHHRELHELLSQLKQMDAAQYQRAIQELSRTHEQLTKLQARSPERYHSELALWKIDSRIRLLVARSAMSDQGAISDQADAREQVRQLLLERTQLRIQTMQAERERLLARVDKLEKTCQSLDQHADAAAEKELDRLFKSVRTKPKSPRTSSAKPAATSKPSSETSSPNSSAKQSTGRKGK